MASEVGGFDWSGVPTEAVVTEERDKNTQQLLGLKVQVVTPTLTGTLQPEQQVP